MANNPLLSIGMIVKNEIRCLEKCLKALQPLRDVVPCELVIADTGSVDGTREIAEQYADIVFDFEWINDFSAARNAVIGRCTGKWYMTVDADEYLKPDIDELVAFLKSDSKDAADYYTVIIRNHQSKDMAGEYSDFPALRIARRTPELHYFGAIHEAFDLPDQACVRGFDHVIFDHDGYSELSPEHYRKKAERNMVLLEQELEKDPTNLWRLLQCLESAAALPEKRFQYAYHVMDLIMNDTKRSRNWKKYSPIIARKAAEIAVAYQLPEADEWCAWARKNFPESLFVAVDVNFVWILRLEARQRYEELAEIGRDYLQGLKRYRKLGPSTPELYASDISKAHLSKENQARLFIARAMRETGEREEAVEVLREIEIAPHDTDTLRKWMYSLEELQEIPAAAELAAEKLGPLFADGCERTEEEKKQYKVALDRINTVFAPPANHTKSFWRLYRNMPGTIGDCVRLVEANDREQASAILAEIDNWELFMPLALSRAMSFELELPEAFYHMPTERLHVLENALPMCDPNYLDRVNDYTRTEYITDWHQLCFAFELLTVVWMRPAEENCDALVERFGQIGEWFLAEYYNPNLLTKEDCVNRLSALHRFTWYCVRAMKLRDSGDLGECVSTLRKALKQSEAMKPLVQYLLDQVRKSQELERAERIASASPELLTLAEQVKTILAQYPADDPAVVALKETPAYQQVAFLIEELNGTAQ